MNLSSPLGYDGSGMSEDLSNSGIPIQDELPKFIRMLRKPAGDDLTIHDLRPRKRLGQISQPLPRR